MKNIIELIENLIKEHYESGYCIDWEAVEATTDAETAMYWAYDCGRYETLTNLLNDIKKIGE